MADTPRRLVLVTGPSGAGLSTATAALEDLGFEAIDNLPIRLVQPLLDHPGPDRPVSLVLDMRNRDFSPQGFLELVDEVSQRPDMDLQVLYLACQPEEILRRYSSTKRRHPILDAPTLADGIAMETELLRPIASRADVLIDTTELNPHELRAEISNVFGGIAASRIAVQVQSFSYRRGVPRSADIVFDCRFLQNPHWVPALRPLDGRSPRVQDYVAQDDRFAAFEAKVLDLILFQLPAAQEEGKSYLSIAFGCTGGKHRSVTLAEKVSTALAEAGWQVSTRHRELDRRPGEEAPK
ncbi:RNase adapter RapZ [Aliishimia ponticola]|uniref:RNase adapter RapZ n=1 Tax=Aliishimia ponticola TaxID=2499833 RepID=A0A4S4N8Y9_9RHOB|nr:RNase adapter RapZ [Aliishimia ponticola]THH35035.1 RNase adapter RapZ [Aliishimia ponticola]